MRIVFLVASAIALWTSSPALSEPMTFEYVGSGGNCNGCEWIAAEGEITADTPEVFRAFIAQRDGVPTVTFNSPGGNLYGGIKLGEIIREVGASTSVADSVPIDDPEAPDWHRETTSGICASACAFAFMGGVERYVDYESLLGVHQFYSDNDTASTSEDVQILSGMTLLYTTRMGIDPDVIVAASQTPPEEIYWFTAEDLAAYGLDTSVQPEAEWRLEPYKAGLVLATTYHESNTRKANVTLFCRAEDRGWQVLISEENRFWADELRDEKIFNFTGEYPNRPSLRVGGQDFAVQAHNLEFEKITGNQISVSLDAPSSIVEAGGQSFSIDADFARVFGSLLYFHVDLPATEWLHVTGQNCI